MKKRISKKDLKQVKNLDLLTYFKSYEPEELIRKGRTDYTTKTYSSLHLSNGLWCHWASGEGGKSALDFFIKVKEWNFLDAAIYLRDIMKSKSPIQHEQTKFISQFKLPIPSPTKDKAIDYLVHERCIDSQIVQYCIDHLLLYEAKDHSIIFIGYDTQQVPKYAFKRATNGTFKQDIAGSDKRFSFSVCNKQSNTLHVFESVIDLLSYMTLLKKSGRDFLKDNYLSIAGASVMGNSIEESNIPVALENFLKNHAQITKIELRLDNDYAGRCESEKIIYHLQNNYEILNTPPKTAKDYNEQLVKKAKSKKIYAR